MIRGTAAACRRMVGIRLGESPCGDWMRWGTVTSIDKPGRAWTGNTADLSFYPERDEVDVVRNGRYAVFDVACKP